MQSLFGATQAPPMFNMPNMGQAAGNYFSGIQGLGQTYGGLGAGVLPQAQQTTQNLYNNPYAGQALGGAQTASGMGQAAAGTGFATGAGMLPYANQIFQTGFDPQSALYNRTAQQLQDQVRTGEAARGIATTPYGAGVENKAMGDFNIDWQNNLLQRMMGAGQAGGALAGQGVGMMGGAAPQWLQSSMYPYATYSDIGSGQMGALGGLLQLGQAGSQLAQGPLNQWQGYLGAGNQAGQVANQNYANQLKNQQQQFGMLGQLGQGIGSALPYAMMML